MAMYINENNGTTSVYFMGDLDKDNILPIKEHLLYKTLHPKIKTVEFHFENVVMMDAPAMAVIVIVIKKLLIKKVTSKVIGLAKKYMDLAGMLKLPLIAEVEAKDQTPLLYRKINSKKKKIRKRECEL